MPIYYFDIDDNGQVLHDVEGSALKDDAAAKAEALATLGSMAKDQFGKIYAEHRFTIEVRNNAGKPIFQASLHLEAHDLI